MLPEGAAHNRGKSSLISQGNQDNSSDDTPYSGYSDLWQADIKSNHNNGGAWRL